MSRRRSVWPLLTLPAAGCMAMGVRSAEVQPGLAATVQATTSSSVGAPAGWFFSFECESNCGDGTVGVDAAVTFGTRDGVGGQPTSVGFGASGVLPYFEGYVQLAEGRVPFGVGARVGLPVFPWRQHQLVARADVPLGRGRTRLLLDPGLFLHEGGERGASRGHVAAFTQGVGLLLPSAYADLTPAVTLVAGHARRERDGRVVESGATRFGALSLGVTFHGRRTR